MKVTLFGKAYADRRDRPIVPQHGFLFNKQGPR